MNELMKKGTHKAAVLTMGHPYIQYPTFRGGSHE